MHYQANPVRVIAHKIVAIGNPEFDNSLPMALDNGENVVASPEMLARYTTPEPGDYWVIQADSYVYLSPKDVFERKYSPVTQPASLLAKACA